MLAQPLSNGPARWPRPQETGKSDRAETDEIPCGPVGGKSEKTLASQRKAVGSSGLSGAFRKSSKGSSRPYHEQRAKLPTTSIHPSSSPAVGTSS